MEIFGQDQKQYLSREFGFDFVGPLEEYKGKVLDSISSGKRPIIQVGTQFSEFEFLKSLPSKSVIIHLFADEIYSPKINRKIIRLSSVAGIIRSYPLYEFSLLRILKSLIFVFCDLFSTKHFAKLAVVAKQFLAGLIMTKRQIIIRLLQKVYFKKSFTIPLGYTDFFAQSFLQVEKLDVADLSRSLISLNKPSQASSKIFSFTFHGQRGQILRELAIEAAKKYPDSNIKVKSSFGGVVPTGGNNLSGIENVDAMQRSKFTIAPPGNYSAQTFRFYEAIICNSVPLTKNFNVSDPLYVGWRQINNVFGMPKSWKELLSNASKLTETEHQKLLGNLQNYLQNVLAISRIQVEKLINS